MRTASIGFAVAAALALVLFFAMQWGNPPSNQTPSQGGQAMLPTRSITIGSTTVVAEVASTPMQKSQGLSGRAALQEGSGMLFVFDAAGAEGFWMKDMHFSIDILWADEDGVIVSISPNLSPQSYPEVFRPTLPAKYVLEVPAGYVSKHGIAVGDKIVLQ